MITLWDTGRLYLREFHPGDAPELIRIASQPHIGRWLPDWRGAEKWAGAWIDSVCRQYLTDDPEREFLALAVVLKQTGKLIGMVSAGGSPRGIAVGYFMDERKLNKGYATEAIRAFCAFLFNRYGYERLTATVQEGNTASNRVVQKAGFAFVSTVSILDSGQTAVLPFYLYHLYNPGLTPCI